MAWSDKGDKVSTRGIAIRARPGEPVSSGWEVGDLVAYQSSLWQIKGMYLAPTPGGDRELWLILGEETKESDGGGRDS